MKSKSLSNPAKMTFYKLLAFSVFMYGSETLTISKIDENHMRIFEMMILEGRRYNSKLYKLFTDADIVKKKKIQPSDSRVTSHEWNSMLQINKFLQPSQSASAVQEDQIYDGRMGLK
jgi:hypothetical protein